MKKYRFFEVFISLLIISGMWMSCGSAGNDANNSNDSIPAALAEINNKIKSDPSNAGLYNDRATYYHNLPDNAKALQDIRRALTIDSTKSDFYVTLGDIYLATDKYTSSESAYLKAVKIDPGYAKALLRLAKFRIIFKNYEEAFDLIQTVVSKDKMNADAYYLAGFTYMEKGDTLSAIKNFLSATEINQNHFDSYIRLGILYSTKHEKLAEGYFKNALRIKPGDQAAHYFLALFYQENGQADKAISTYDALLVINPKYRDAWYNLGYIQMSEIFDFGKAIEYYEKAIMIDANYIEAIMNRGYCFERLGEYEKAEVDYKKVLGIKPNYPKAIEGLNRLK